MRPKCIPRTHERREHAEPNRTKSPGSTSKKRRARIHQGPGGIIFIIGPKWGPSLIDGRSDDSGHGALAEIQLRTTQGKIHILGTYWPERPERSHITPLAVNLWSKIQTWLHSRHNHVDDPIQYLQRLAIKWAHTALRSGGDAVILAGDLNSTWKANERGGQRAIENWCDANYLINGPRLISDCLNIPFITRGHEVDEGSWIDHILHIGDPNSIDILGAFNSRDSGWEGVTDHRPLWAHYATHKPITEHPVRPPPLKPRVELPRGDHRQITDFRHKLSTVVKQIPYTGEESREAEIYLENLSAFIVETTEDINDTYRSAARQSSYKDGFSPEFLINKWHLQAVIEVRRHLLGRKGRLRWSLASERKRDITLLHRAGSLGLSAHKVDKIL